MRVGWEVPRRAIPIALLVALLSGPVAAQPAPAPSWEDVVGDAAPGLPAPPAVRVGPADALPVSFGADGESRALFAAWRPALERAGYRVAELLVDETHHVVAHLDGPNGGRGGVVLQDWQGRIHGSLDWVAHPVTAPMPGACVTPPVRTYRVEVTSREAWPPPEREDPEPVVHGFSTQPFADVDGDGRFDVMVPTVELHTCPHDVEYAIYVMRGACGHEVGRVVGSPGVVGPRVPGRLRELRAERRWASITHPDRPPGPSNVATLHEVSTPYRARGGRYVAGTPTETGGICHHCGMPSCRRLP